ncbi:MAG: 50S ribosomal protein L15 [Patescibacteria group bacterium]
MKLNELPKIVTKSKKRLGRGHGSGKVKTGGRGTKGQKARESIRLGFEGGQLPLVKRLPLWRGRGRNRSRQPKAYTMSLSRLSGISEGSEVTLAFLKKHHFINEDVVRVKLVGKGTLPKSITVAVPCSKGVQSIIEKAGGKIISTTS